MLLKDISKNVASGASGREQWLEVMGSILRLDSKCNLKGGDYQGSWFWSSCLNTCEGWVKHEEKTFVTKHTNQYFGALKVTANWLAPNTGKCREFNECNCLQCKWQQWKPATNSKKIHMCSYLTCLLCFKLQSHYETKLLLVICKNQK